MELYQEEVEGENGTVLVKEDVKISLVKKYKGPDIVAIRYWLNNRKKAQWKDDPNKVENDKKALKIKEKEIASKSIEIQRGALSMKDKDTLRKLGKLYMELGEICNKMAELEEKEEAGETIPESQINEIIGEYMLKALELQKVANGQIKELWLLRKSSFY